jgi:DNA ligase (NAD+)
VDGIGPETAREVRRFFDEPVNRKVLDRMLDHGFEIAKVTQRRERSNLAGLKFVITGTLWEMSREEAKAAVRRHGGNATSSVTGETDYLVVGENPGTSKMAAAEEHGTERIDEEKFARLLEG